MAWTISTPSTSCAFAGVAYAVAMTGVATWGTSLPRRPLCCSGASAASVAWSEHLPKLPRLVHKTQHRDELDQEPKDQRDMHGSAVAQLAVVRPEDTVAPEGAKEVVIARLRVATA
eukprot:scaffold4501_cov320-Pinguiococcus_pyrenoidosus.AAC.10